MDPVTAKYGFKSVKVQTRWSPAQLELIDRAMLTLRAPTRAAFFDIVLIAFIERSRNIVHVEDAKHLAQRNVSDLHAGDFRVLVAVRPTVHRCVRALALQFSFTHYELIKHVSLWSAQMLLNDAVAFAQLKPPSVPEVVAALQVQKLLQPTRTPEQQAALLSTIQPVRLKVSQATTVIGLRFTYAEFTAAAHPWLGIAERATKALEAFYQRNMQTFDKNDLLSFVRAEREHGALRAPTEWAQEVRVRFKTFHVDLLRLRLREVSEHLVAAQAIKLLIPKEQS